MSALRNGPLKLHTSHYLEDLGKCNSITMKTSSIDDYITE